MKTIRVLFIFLIVFSGFCKVTGQNNMILNFYSSPSREIAINSIRKITFSQGNLVVNKADANSENVSLTDISKITFGIASAVNTINSNHFFDVYPNPASHYITVKNQSVKNCELSILSLDGRKLIQKRFSSEKESIDVSALVPGIYVIMLNEFATRFIKQ